MKLLRGILFGAMLIGTYAAVADDIYEDMLDTPEALKKWSNSKALEFLPKGGPENEPAVKMTNTDPAGSVMSDFRMDIEKVRGKTIKVTAKVKGENISKPDKAWLGMKLMFVVTGADGKLNYPDVAKTIGSFDWKKVQTVTTVPADAKAINLSIGLQNATGTIYFSDMEIEEVD